MSTPKWGEGHETGDAVADELIPREGERMGDSPTTPKHVNIRWRRTALLLLAIIVALTSAAGVGAFIGIRQERDRWTPIVGQATADAAHWKLEAEQWRQSSEVYQQSNQTYLAQMQELERKISTTIGDLEHPSFVLWNSCGAGGPAAGCPLRPGQEYVGGVPDTFTYFVSFRSTVPVTVWIMSVPNFVCWETHLCAWKAFGWEDRMSLQDAVFHDAEGCAGYISVFFSTQVGAFYPDVRITRNPAAGETGVCVAEP